MGRHLRTGLGHHVAGLSRKKPRAGAADEFSALDLARPLPEKLGTFDAVVHAAALTSPWARAEEYRRHNIKATVNVINFVRKAAIPHLVFISTGSVFYTDGDQFDITEATPFPDHPVSEFAASKIAAERLVRMTGADATILRPPVVFGAGDTSLFPRILGAARKGLLPRFTRAGGTQAVSDLISIDNLVHFIGQALEKRATGDFNLTDGSPVEIYEFLGNVLTQLAIRPPHRAVPADTAMRVAGVFEVTSKYALGWRQPPLTRAGVAALSQSKTFDIGKAIAAFGPPPVPTDVAVERFVAWQKQQPR